MKLYSSRRNTRQRQVILDELRRLSSHPTAATLYESVRRQLPKISLGTVYRNLELLARIGLIRKLEFAGSETRFDGDIARHDHVRCLRCGRVDDTEFPPLDLAGGNANDWGGYQISGYRLEFFGVCAVCGGRRESDGANRPHGLSAGDVKSNRDPVRVSHKPR